MLKALWALLPFTVQHLESVHFETEADAFRNNLKWRNYSFQKSNNRYYRFIVQRISIRLPSSRTIYILPCVRMYTINSKTTELKVKETANINVTTIKFKWLLRIVDDLENELKQLPIRRMYDRTLCRMSTKQ